MYWRNLAPKSAQEDAPASSEQEMSKTRNLFIAQQTRSCLSSHLRLVCATTRADGLAIIKEPTPAGIWSSKKLTIEQPLAAVEPFTHTLLLTASRRLSLHRLERKHRAGRMTHNFFSHIADDQALDARPTVGREHDEIN